MDGHAACAMASAPLHAANYSLADANWNCSLAVANYTLADVSLQHTARLRCMCRGACANYNSPSNLSSLLLTIHNFHLHALASWILSTYFLTRLHTRTYVLTRYTPSCISSTVLVDDPLAAGRLLESVLRERSRLRSGSGFGGW